MLVTCTVAEWQEIPPYVYVLYTKVKALTFVLKVQVYLGALTYGNRACQLFTVCGFNLIIQPQIFFAILFLKLRDGSPSQAHDTRHTQFPYLLDWQSKSRRFIPTQREILSSASPLLFKIFYWSIHTYPPCAFILRYVFSIGIFVFACTLSCKL